MFSPRSSIGEPQRADQELPCEFFGKRWIFFAQAIIIGGLAVFSLVMGPLFLLELVKDARNKPRPEAGFAMMIASVPLIVVFAAAMFNIRARRSPIIRIYREGIEVRRIGFSTLDRFPLPALVRVFWSLVSLQAFRQVKLRVDWPRYTGAAVTGASGARVLTLRGEFFDAAGDPSGLLSRTTHAVAFAEHAFVRRLEAIATTIQCYHDSDSRRNLASWHQATAD
jgi:hypothetical protein